MLNRINATMPHTARTALKGNRTPDPDAPRYRRGSRRRRDGEPDFWRRISRQEVNHVLVAAKRYDRVGRQPGTDKPNGPLGHVALELLELLGNLVCLRTGRLEPSYAYLMQMLGRSKDAVSKALTALREHGFLERLRRIEPTEIEGKGPQVRQCANAYRLMLPAKAARLVSRWFVGEAPVPDDVAQESEEREAEVKAMKATLPLDELALLEVEDDRLGRILADLGRKVQERESAARTET